MRINFSNIKFKKVVNNYTITALSSYTIANLVTAIVSFLAIGWFTKYLTPDDYGKATMVWLFVSIVSMFVDCRLNTAFSIKFYKNSKEENTVNLYTILLFNILIGSFIFIIFLLLPNVLNSLIGTQINTSVTIIIYFLVLLMIIGQFYMNLLMISQKPSVFFKIKMLYNLVYVVTALLSLIVFKQGYISYIYSYVISYLIISILGVRYFYINYSPTKKCFFSSPRLKELLKIGLPLIPNGLLLMLLTWEDRYVLKIYSGLVIVGIYSVGYRFAELPNNFLFTPFGQAISPTLYKEGSQNENEYKQLMSRIFKYYWIFSIGILIGYFVILKEGFNLFISSNYSEGYNVIGILLIGMIFLGISNIIGATIVIKEKTRKVFLITFISLIFNTVLNFILIPKFNMYGAAYATTISYIINLIVTIIYSQKLIYVKYDYLFIFKTGIIVAIFFLSIMYVSYLNLSVIMLIFFKLCIFAFFIIYTVYFTDIISVIKEAFSGGTKSI